MIVLCPCCGFEVDDPRPEWSEPEWVDDQEVLEELCSACERDYYRDEAAVP